MQKYKITEIQKHRNAEIHKCTNKNADIQKYGNTKNIRNAEAQKHKCINTTYRNTEIQKRRNAKRIDT